MPNYGSNGQTIATLFQIRVLRLAAIAAANVDLVVFSYGINDIRTNIN
jgi:lysophospholipase L1-like esterase